jgi:hypothetical protein
VEPRHSYSWRRRAFDVTARLLNLDYAAEKVGKYFGKIKLRMRHNLEQVLG